MYKLGETLKGVSERWTLSEITMYFKLGLFF